MVAQKEEWVRGSRKNSEERGDLPSGTASSRTGTGSACSRRGLQGERLGEARYTSPHHTQGGGGKGQGSPRDSRLEDRSPTAFKVQGPVRVGERGACVRACVCVCVSCRVKYTTIRAGRRYCAEYSGAPHVNTREANTQ